MHTLRLLLFVITGLAVLSGCSRIPPAGVRLPQDLLVHTLQDRLRILRAAAPSDNIGFLADLDPAPLVGLGLDQIRDAFGAPAYCWDAGPSSPPCKEHGKWIYVFHHFPESAFGGGTEQMLTIGPARHVDSAQWIRTQ